LPQASASARNKLNSVKQMNRKYKVEYFKYVVEAIIITAGCLAVYFLSSNYDLLEKLVEFSSKHESFELDEVILVAIFLLFSSTVILIRRIGDLLTAYKELDKRNTQLQKAFAEINQLEKFIPICASCKKIRDDKGFWQQVEDYMLARSGTKFTHSICPDCALKLYPEFVGEAIKKV